MDLFLVGRGFDGLSVDIRQTQGWQDYGVRLAQATSLYEGLSQSWSPRAAV